MFVHEGSDVACVFPQPHDIGRFVEHRSRCVEHHRYHDQRGDGYDRYGRRINHHSSAEFHRVRRNIGPGDDGAASPADTLLAHSFCHYD